LLSSRIIFCFFFFTYVEDVIISRTSSADIASLIPMLHKHFSLKHLGSLHYFLRIEISWNREGNLNLSQSKYIKDLLQETENDRL